MNIVLIVSFWMFSWISLTITSCLTESIFHFVKLILSLQFLNRLIMSLSLSLIFFCEIKLLIVQFEFFQQSSTDFCFVAFWIEIEIDENFILISQTESLHNQLNVVVASANIDSSSAFSRQDRRHIYEQVECFDEWKWNRRKFLLEWHKWCKKCSRNESSNSNWP